MMPQLPLRLALWCGPLVPIQPADRQLYVKVWQVRVGRQPVLSDTNVEENNPADRTLSARLYTADQEERLRQLIVWALAVFGC
jgi:starch phosphorylase